VGIDRLVVFPTGFTVSLDHRKDRIAFDACEGAISFDGVLGAKTLIVLALRLIPSAAAMPPAAAALPAMAPRIDLLECFADVLVGGVLSTLLALAI
jgi:hypothetical protein